MFILRSVSKKCLNNYSCAIGNLFEIIHYLQIHNYGYKSDFSTVLASIELTDRIYNISWELLSSICCFHGFIEGIQYTIS